MTDRTRNIIRLAVVIIAVSLIAGGVLNILGLEQSMLRTMIMGAIVGAVGVIGAQRLGLLKKPGAGED